MGAVKKAKKFVNLLSEKLISDAIAPTNLAEAFDDAVDCLPTGILKSELSENTKSYFGLLMKNFAKVDTNASHYKTPTEDGFDIKNTTYSGHTISDSDVALNFQLANDFSTLPINYIQKELKKMKPVKGYSIPQLAIIHKLSSLMVGRFHSKDLAKLLKLYEREITPLVDKAFQAGNLILCNDLICDIHTFFELLQLRISCRDTTEEGLYSSLANVLTMYLDLAISANRTGTVKYNLSQMTLLVIYMLRSQPHTFLDVILQMESITKNNAGSVLPVIRTLLAKANDLTKPSNYVKYLTIVKTLLFVFGSQVEDVKTNAYKVSVPDDFLEWLGELVPSALEHMPICGKFKGAEVTKFFLEEETMEGILYILQALTDHELNDDGELEKDGEPCIHSEIQGADGSRLHTQGHPPDNHPDEGLFFVDTTADSSNQDVFKTRADNSDVLLSDDSDGRENGHIEPEDVDIVINREDSDSGDFDTKITNAGECTTAEAQNVVDEHNMLDETDPVTVQAVSNAISCVSLLLGEKTDDTAGAPPVCLSNVADDPARDLYLPNRQLTNEGPSVKRRRNFPPLQPVRRSRRLSTSSATSDTDIIVSDDLREQHLPDTNRDSNLTIDESSLKTPRRSGRLVRLDKRGIDGVKSKATEMTPISESPPLACL